MRATRAAFRAWPAVRVWPAAVACLVLLGAMGPAAAQTAPGAPGAPAAAGIETHAASPPAGPEGNAHPDLDQISGDADAPNPFGEPTSAAGMTMAAKRALAEAVDLSPLADVAVFHAGRVKVLDTLSREMVQSLTGRARYDEFVVAPGPTEAASAADGAAGAATASGGALPERVKFDPLFTWLDLLIDPGFYAPRPLIAVDYLPLRELYLEAAFGADTTLRERWKKTGRVSPAMVAQFSTPILEQHDDDAAVGGALKPVERAFRLYAGGAANVVLVAPSSREEPWRHLGTRPADAPERRAAAALGAAWRAGDAAGVNAAAAELASLLKAQSPGVYPQGRRALELAYNRFAPFEIGMWLYLLSVVSLVLAFGTGRGWLRGAGLGLLLAAVLAHGAGFAARCVIAERLAIQNQFESMTGLSLFAAVVGLVVMWAKRQPLFGAASAATGFLVLIAATKTAIPGQVISSEAAILNTSVLLKYHVTTVLTSYGLITLGFIVSLFYLASHYGAALFGRSEAQVLATGALGGSVGGAIGGSADGSADSSAGGAADGAAGREGPTNARLLADLDTAQMTVLQLAFWTLGVGILLGAWWADHSWGRWWAFDPKETWALITWIVYLIVIHVRFASPSTKGLLTAWLSVTGFFVMVWTYFGVNLLLPGLHAYA